ncbi:MAG: T9SS type A sorting domain-containing protein, partial [candidate division Zixibacteria bacterium]
WNIDLASPEDVADAQALIAQTIYESYQEIPVGSDDPFLPEIETQPEIASYPNPFNAQATIHLNGFEDSEPIRISIYDLLGREVRSLEALSSSERGFAVWDGRDDNGLIVASGVYLIRAETAKYSAVTKSLLMK